MDSRKKLKLMFVLFISLNKLCRCYCCESEIAGKKLFRKKKYRNCKLNDLFGLSVHHTIFITVDNFVGLSENTIYFVDLLSTKQTFVLLQMFNGLSLSVSYLYQKKIPLTTRSLIL